MSFVSVVSRMASLTTVTLEDGYGDKHDVQGMVTYGPIQLAPTRNSNGFIFGTEIDKMFREAKWTLVGKNGASGAVTWLLGDPPDEHDETDPRTGLKIYPNDAPLFEQVWLTDDQGDALRTYNSHKFIPPLGFPFERGGPPWIELGISKSSTTRHCADAVDGRPYVPGEWVGIDHYWMSFPVDDYGSLANERFLGSNGFSAVSANNVGAGKIYESQPLGDDPANMTKLRVTMSMTDQNFDGNITILICALQNNGDGTYSKIGDTVITVMMAQPDYCFMLDPYSFYMFSLKSDSHADLYRTTTLFATMLNTLPAMPQHLALPAIPQTVLIGTNLGERLMMGANGDAVWRYGSASIPGSVDENSGVSFHFIRNNPGPLYDGDDSDVVDAARVLVSTDGDGPGGKSSGPMWWLGNLWNGISIQRELPPIFGGWSPDTPEAGEELLPKIYRSMWFQSGSEEVYFFHGTMGTVLLAGADYGYLRKFDDVQTDPATGFTPISIAVIGEGNLFSPIRSISGAFVRFHITGGRPVRWDPMDESNDLPAELTITAHGYPTDGSWQFKVDGEDSCHLESGNPGSVGTWLVSISVHDTFGNAKTLLYNLVVGPSTVLRWANDQLPIATTGVPYFMQGGSRTTTFTFAGGILPPGMFFDAKDGTLSGIPNTEGLYDFSIGMVDGVLSMTRNFIFQVN